MIPRTPRTPSLIALAAAAPLLAGCAARMTPPPPGAAEAARAASSYSATLRVSLQGPEVRARTRALLAFRRPDALRIEIPGPAGARFVAVAAGDRLWAVFPASRAVFTGSAAPADLEALLGLALGPAEVMDVLVGAPPARLRAYEASWGPRLPRKVKATLPDGARLDVTVEDAEAEPALGAGAFVEPPHDGYRAVEADEARRLWSAR